MASKKKAPATSPKVPKAYKSKSAAPRGGPPVVNTGKGPGGGKMVKPMKGSGPVTPGNC